MKNKSMFRRLSLRALRVFVVILSPAAFAYDSPAPLAAVPEPATLALLIAAHGTIIIRGTGLGSYCGIVLAPSFPRRRSSSARIS